MVTPYMPPHHGGIERVAHSLFVAYRARGHDVAWVASRAPRQAPAREDTRVRVPCWNGLERWLGVPVPLWGPGGWRAVAALVARADVLHVHDCVYPSSAVACLLAARAGTPVLLSQHVGPIAYRLAPLNWAQRSAYATLGRAVLRRASRIVLATPAAEALVPALLDGLPDTACSVANGIDLRRFAPASVDDRRRARLTLGLAGEEPVVLFVGRLVEKKGIDLVLEVAGRLADVRFLVVGDGPLAGRVARAPANVRWRRAVPPDGMGECYRAADALLLPSHGEGLPVVVQEAMASALPVIVSATEDYAARLAAEGVAVPTARTVDAISDAVRRAANGEAAAVAARARRYAAAHWDADAMADRYLELLQEVAGAAGRAPRAAAPR